MQRALLRSIGGAKRPPAKRSIHCGVGLRHQGRGSTYNPWDLGRVPGGSSGGSAAAVATGIVPLALGSDSGGSIRIPASYCGVAGIKPTYGRISKRGACRFPSCDHVGPIARSVRDLGTAMSALAGYDAEDPSTLTELFDEPMIERGIEGLRIGIAPDLHLTPLAPDHEKIFSHVVDTATSIAGTAREVHIPYADVIRPAFTIIHLSESHHVHASELGIYPCENVATPPTRRGVGGCVRAEERVRGGRVLRPASAQKELRGAYRSYGRSMIRSMICLLQDRPTLPWILADLRHLHP